MYARHHDLRSSALVGSLLCFSSSIGLTQTSTSGASFMIHGVPKSCSDITQLDSALTSGTQYFFAGWGEKDYADALTWSQACAYYGWHIPGRPRIPLLVAQRDRALGSSPPASPAAPAAPTGAPADVPPAAPAVAAPDASAEVPPGTPAAAAPLAPADAPSSIAADAPATVPAAALATAPTAAPATVPTPAPAPATAAEPVPTPGLAAPAPDPYTGPVVARNSASTTPAASPAGSPAASGSAAAAPTSSGAGWSPSPLAAAVAESVRGAPAPAAALAPAVPAAAAPAAAVDPAAQAAAVAAPAVPRAMAVVPAVPAVPADAAAAGSSVAIPLATAPAPIVQSLAVPAASTAVVRSHGSPSQDQDDESLLTDNFVKQHFHQESVWVANRAHLDIGGGSGAPTSPQMKNRITADKIVLYCARKTNSGESGSNRPLLWDWRWCESEEAAAYNRVVSGNEFPTAGRAQLLGCAGVESYVYMERCMQTLSESGPMGPPRTQ